MPHAVFPNSFNAGVSQAEQRFKEFERILLYNWSTYLANPSMWFVVIDKIPNALMDMNNDNTLNKEGPNKYTQFTMNQQNLFNVIENGIGCMIIHGVVLPTIEASGGRESPAMGGYYGGVVMDSINEQAQLTLQFRETHSSALDFIFRPWVELSAKNGAIARPPGDPRFIKCNITVMQTGIVGGASDPIIRKAWRFNNCQPTSVANTSLAHDGTWGAADMYVNTEWVYSDYDLHDVEMDNMSALYDQHDKSGQGVEAMRQGHFTRGPMNVQL
jgi:hypothetical protein